MALKDTAEIVWVGKTEHFGDFVNGQLRALQKIFGAADAEMIEVLDRRFAGLFFEYFIHVPRGEMDQIGELRFVADRCIIIVDISENPADISGIGARGMLLHCRV